MRPVTIAASIAPLTRSQRAKPCARGRTPTRRRTSRVRPALRSSPPWPATRTLGLSRPLVEITPADISRSVLEDICPIDDIRSTAAYRRHVAVALVTTFFEGLSGPSDFTAERFLRARDSDRFPKGQGLALSSRERTP